MLPVRDYIQHFAEIWENSPSHFPSFSKEYSTQEKRSREANYELFQEKIKSLQNRKEIKAIKSDPGASFFPMSRPRIS